MSSSLHKGNDKGWSWNALGTVKYMGDKEAPIMSCLTQGIEKLTFLAIKFTGKKQDVSAYYSYYNTTIGILSASHTGNVNDLYNSITNKVPSVVNGFTYAIRNQSRSATSFGKSKLQLLF
jgi:iron complex outermembrane receptor protein